MTPGTTDKAILKKWLKAGFVYQNELFPTDAGTPQGGIISPVAANMTLDGLAWISTPHNSPNTGPVFSRSQALMRSV